MSTFRTYDLAVKFYRAAAVVKLPAHLKSQMLRAASSVPLNLTEGAARGSFADRVRFYRIAYASFRESMAVLDLVDVKTTADFVDLADYLGACLYKLVNQSPR